MSESFSASGRPNHSPDAERKPPANKKEPWFQEHSVTIAVTMIVILAAAIGFLAASVLSKNDDAVSKDDETEWVEIEMDYQYEIAIHEAGHTVVSYIVSKEQEIGSVFLKTEKRESDAVVGLMLYSEGALEETVETLDARTLVDYAGEVAEKVILGNEPYKESPDFRHANKNLYERLRKLCEDAEVCEKLLTDEMGGVIMMRTKVLELEKMSQERARVFIVANSDAVKRLANRLILQPEVERRRTLSSEELYEFLNAQTLIDPEKEYEEKEDAGSE